MKSSHKILLRSVLVTGALFTLSSCVTDGYVSTGVYYGPRRDPWFRDDPWMDGHRWYRRDRYPDRGSNVDIYISPPRISGQIRLPLPPGIGR